MLEPGLGRPRLAFPGPELAQPQALEPVPELLRLAFPVRVPELGRLPRAFPAPELVPGRLLRAFLELEPEPRGRRFRPSIRLVLHFQPAFLGPEREPPRQASREPVPEQPQAREPGPAQPQPAFPVLEPELPQAPVPVPTGLPEPNSRPEPMARIRLASRVRELGPAPIRPAFPVRELRPVSRELVPERPHELERPLAPELAPTGLPMEPNIRPVPTRRASREPGQEPPRPAFSGPELAQPQVLEPGQVLERPRLASQERVPERPRPAFPGREQLLGPEPTERVRWSFHRRTRPEPMERIQLVSREPVLGRILPAFPVPEQVLAPERPREQELVRPHGREQELGQMEQRWSRRHRIRLEPMGQPRPAFQVRVPELGRPRRAFLAQGQVLAQRLARRPVQEPLRRASREPVLRGRPEQRQGPARRRIRYSSL